MKRFKVEHNDYRLPVTYITLFNPPYENEDGISRTKWKLKDVKITEEKLNEGMEEWQWLKEMRVAYLL